MKTRRFIELKDKEYITEEEYLKIKEDYAGDSFYISTKDYEFSSEEEKIRYIQNAWQNEKKSVKQIATELGMSENRVHKLKNIRLINNSTV